MSEPSLIPVERIQKAILVLRGHKVLLDTDRAAMYGVETKALVRAVKRNLDKFPEDFMFRLTATEKAEVITNCDHLRQLRFSPSLPHAFTEHGAIITVSNPRCSCRLSSATPRVSLKTSCSSSLVTSSPT